MSLLRVYRSASEGGNTNPPATPPAPTPPENTNNNATTNPPANTAVPIPPPQKPVSAPETKTADPNADVLKAMQDKMAAMETQLRDQTRARIIAETGIKTEAGEFITATDEAGMKAQAEKLKGLFAAPASEGKPAEKPADKPAGTVTNPAGTSQPTLDEQIAAAEKAKNTMLAIQLKRKKMFG